MTQNIRIERVRRVSWGDRLSAIRNIDEMVLFDAFYILFGFLISGSLFVASYSAFFAHHEYLTTLFAVAPASCAVWGIFYGAWVTKMRWAWNALVALSTLATAGGVLAVSAVPGFAVAGLLPELIGCSIGLPVLWAILMGLRHIDF